MGIGRRIKEARDAKHWTQARLAKEIGVTPSSITNYENETSHPKEKILYDLMNVLEIDANFLFQDMMQKKSISITKDEETLITSFRSLKEEDKQIVLNFVSSMIPKYPFGYDETIHEFIDLDGARAYLKEQGQLPLAFTGGILEDDLCTLATVVYHKNIQNL